MPTIGHNTWIMHVRRGVYVHVHIYADNNDGRYAMHEQLSWGFRRGVDDVGMF